MIYLDNSATTFPKPEKVYKEMIDLYQKYGVNVERGNYKLSLEAHALVQKIRLKINNFFNGYSEECVVFTYNATDALNIAINGVIEENDRVITTVLEHNSVLRPLNHLKKSKRIEVEYLNPSGEKIDTRELKARLDKRTKLVVVNHSSNVTGYTQDLEAIGRCIKENSSAYFLVDASQSAGVIPVDIKRASIDFFVTTGHKALYGPTGIGLLILNPEVKIRPFRVGGSGHSSENPYQPDNFPDRLEAGTLNILGVFGLKAGIEFIEETGIEKIHSKELKLKKLLLENLENKKIKILTSKEDSSPAIVSILHCDYSPADLANILDSEFGIATRAGLHCAPLAHKFLGTFPYGTLRVSIGYFNTEEEILTLSSVLNQL
jgi:cysteine desulfurase family protein